MHSAPVPAHPSYRLLIALRLMHVLLSAKKCLMKYEMQEWREMVAGTRDTVSKTNEQETLGSVLEISAVLRDRAEKMTSAIQKEKEHRYSGWSVIAVETVSALWKEEKAVADAVASSVRRGEEF